MALNLGELAAIVTLDDSKFDSGLDGSESKFKRFGGRLKAGAALAGAAAGAALAAGLAQALEFDKANDRLAAQLRLTEEESERVGGVSGALFADAYGQNIGEVNEALRGIIAQTGDLGDVTDEELSDMGAAALDLASILGVDVTRVVQVAGQAMRNGLADNMTEAFDLIAAASAETMPGLEADLLDAADEYGVFFSQLGLSGEEAFGMLAAASEQGMFGIDKTGDALKEFTIRAADMSTGSVEAFNAIGLNADDMAAKILAGGDTARGAFDQIIGGLLAMEDPVAQQTAAIGLFGTPIEDLSTSQIPEFLAALDSSESALQDVGGAAGEMGDALNDNAATGFESLKRKGMDALMSAMEPMLPILTSLFTILEPIAPVLGVLAVALGIASAAVWVFSAALWANPITWIIAAVIALAAAVWLIVDNWDAVSAWLVDAWEWIKEKVAEIWDAIKQFFIDWWPLILGIFTGGIGLLIGLIIQNWDQIKAVTKTVFSAIGNFFVSIWEFFVELFKTHVRAAIAVVGWFAQLPGKVSGWFGGVKDAAVDKLRSLLSWITGLPGKIKNALGNLGSLLWDAGKDLLRGLIDGIESMWGSVQDKLASLTSKLPDWKGPAERDRSILGPAGEMVIGGFVDGLDRAIPNVRRVLDGLTTDIGLQVDQGAAPRQAGPTVIAAPAAPGEFTATVPIDLGEGLQQVVQIKLERRDRDLKRRVGAGTGAAR